MTAYYNEIDPYAAQWLRNLISAGHIAPGDVDERSILDVRPDDLRRYAQCHFFAGIGVWSYALRRAGWRDDRPVWTGSCPCQPFSAAGKGGGFDDERHLWPAFHHLIRECRPGVILGEQVASKDGLAWLDLVQADLEGTGYASGAVDLCAAGVGSPNIRQRLWWIGERLDDPASARHVGSIDRAEGSSRNETRLRLSGARRAAGGMDDDDDPRLEGQRGRHQAASGRVGTVRPASEAGQSGGLEHPDSDRPSSIAGDVGEVRRVPEAQCEPEHRAPVHGRRGDSGGVGNAECVGAGRDAGAGVEAQGGPALRGIGHNSGSPGPASRPGPTNGLWRDADWLFCRDGKWRPVEPGTFPLAHGAPARVGRLRGYGNAINAEAAVAFIESYLDIGTIDLVADGFRLTETSVSSVPMGVFA